ncbi:MAG: MarR family winged helix-turn-helix transcriptional regulator [Jatrophihabitantaceae bacterium]
MTAARKSVEPEATVSDEAVAVAETFVNLMRSFGRQRAEILAAKAHDVEWSAQLVLKCVSGAGPLRSSEVAEHLRADPSTVSRQVAGLVKEGLLERRADPEDGRACLLVLTEKADDVLREHDHIRNQHFAAMLADWSERDLRRFAGLLARFTHDLETASNKLISGPAANQPRSAEGNR